MTVHEMKTRKRELGYSNHALAQISGVPVGTLQKIFSGATKAPRRETILALERALSQKETDFVFGSLLPEKEFLRVPLLRSKPRGSPDRGQGKAEFTKSSSDDDRVRNLFHTLLHAV